MPLKLSIFVNNWFYTVTPEDRRRILQPTVVLWEFEERVQGFGAKVWRRKIGAVGAESPHSI